MTTLNRLPMLIEAMPKTRKDAGADRPSPPAANALLETAQNSWDYLVVSGSSVLQPGRSSITGLRMLPAFFEDISIDDSQCRLMNDSPHSRVLLSKED